MRPVDVISDALHRQTLCDDAPGCAVIHDTEAEQIAAALRRAGWRFVDVETLERTMRFVMGNGIGLVSSAATGIISKLDGEAAS